jgi:hypothetical protein
MSPVCQAKSIRSHQGIPSMFVDVNGGDGWREDPITPISLGEMTARCIPSHLVRFEFL